MANLVDVVFEGGGAKGAVFVGALKALEERDWKLRRLVGTSAGAITASLLGAGYTPKQLEEFSNEKGPDGKSVFSTFMDLPAENSFAPDVREGSLTMRLMKRVDIPLVPQWAERGIDRQLLAWLLKVEAYRQIFSFIERGGMYAGDAFLKWIRAKLDGSPRGRLGELSLKEFAEKTGSDVSFAVSDTTDRELRVLNHRTAPACPVAWAVRMSMSIPFIWQEVIWNPEWGAYLGEDLRGHVMIDGGVLSNFPMEYIVSGEPQVRAVMGDTDPKAAGNLGLLIDETEAVDGSGKRRDYEVDPAKGGLFADAESLKVLHRVRRIVGALMESHDRTIMEAHDDEICHLPAEGYGTTEFDMSDERMAALIKGGYNATIAYIQKPR